MSAEDLTPREWMLAAAVHYFPDRRYDEHTSDRELAIALIDVLHPGELDVPIDGGGATGRERSDAYLLGFAGTAARYALEKRAELADWLEAEQRRADAANKASRERYVDRMNDAWKTRHAKLSDD